MSDSLPSLPLSVKRRHGATPGGTSDPPGVTRRPHHERRNPMSKTLANATIREIREALNVGLPDATLGQTIDEMRQSELDHLERERQASLHAAYEHTRYQRRQAAVNAAVRDALADAERRAPDPNRDGYRRFRDLTGRDIKLSAGERDHIANERPSRPARRSTAQNRCSAWTNGSASGAPKCMSSTACSASPVASRHW